MDIRSHLIFSSIFINTIILSTKNLSSSDSTVSEPEKRQHQGHIHTAATKHRFAKYDIGGRDLRTSSSYDAFQYHFCNFYTVRKVEKPTFIVNMTLMCFYLSKKYLIGEKRLYIGAYQFKNGCEFVNIIGKAKLSYSFFFSLKRKTSL